MNLCCGQTLSWDVCGTKRRATIRTAMGSVGKILFAVGIKRSKRYYILWAVALFIIIWSGVGQARTLTLTWGTPALTLQAKAQLIGSSFFVSAEFIEELGGTVSRQGDTIHLTYNDESMEIFIHKQRAEVNNTIVSMATYEQDDSVWLSLRSLADHLLRARLSFAGNTLRLLPWSSSSLSDDFILTSQHNIVEEQDDVTDTRQENIEFVTDTLGQVAAEQPASSQKETRDNVKSADNTTSTYEPDRDRLRAVLFGTTTVSAASVPHDLLGFDQPFDAVAFVSLDRRTTTRPPLPNEYAKLPRQKVQRPQIKSTVLRAQRSDWIETTLTNDEDGRDVIHIAMSQPVEYNTFLLTDPARLVIDLQGLDTGHADMPLTGNNNNVKQVRLNQNTPDTVRVVVDLTDLLGYTVNIDESKQQVTVRLNHALRTVKTDFAKQSGTIQVHVPRETEYEISRLTDPERLVIDLFDTTIIRGVLEEIVVDNEGPIEDIRVEQSAPDRSRIVLELARNLDIAPDAHNEWLTFHIGKRIGSVGYAMVPDTGFVLHIDGAQLDEPQVMYLGDPDRLVIDVPGAVLAHNLMDALITADVAWRIRIGQHPDMVRLVVDLKSSVEYAIIRLPDVQGFMVAALLPSLAGKTIFLDPGHGGSDPGTLGRKLGLAEKDVVLDIAFRLQKLLHDAGAQAVLSRESDTLIPLERRPQMAHEAGADAFLSIHANASTSNAKASGTETYVYSGSTNPENARLATAVLRHLVNSTGLVNRGVKRANFAVLRHAKLPATLVEIAFLSNEQEEQLLAESWFREEIAQGLFNGVVAFMSEGSSREAKHSENMLARFRNNIADAFEANEFTYLQSRQDHDNAYLGAVQVVPLQ